VMDQARGGAIQHAADVASNIWDKAQAYAAEPLEPGQVRGLDTGWRDLNDKLGGWKPGLYTVLGEPHVGKSFFTLTAAQNVAAQGKRALVFSLEMTADQLIERLALAEARLDRHDYEAGRIPDAAWSKFAERIGEISGWDLDIVDDQESASAITSTIHRECRGDNPPALVAIDYLGLVVTDYRGENRNEELSTLLRNFKRLSATCQIPLIVPHQISDKAIEHRTDKRPKKSDGYGSGGIAQHSDVILGLYQEALHTESPENENALEVIKLKDRLSGGADPYVRVVLTFEPTGGLRDRTYQDDPLS